LTTEPLPLDRDGTSVGRRGRLPLAREGYALIGGAAAATLVLWLVGWTVAAVLGLALTVFIVSFFRDPERVVPGNPRAIVAPADGRVIKITAVRDERFLHADGTLVSIFMSPLNVHVNRVPVSGRVIDVRYHPGRYFRAFADKASLDNEQNAVVVEDEHGHRLCFVQIAGFIARRIVCRLQAGMAVTRGQRYGMIMFGSRADIYLPAAAQVRLAVGDRAVGGETVIAEWA
jgi:phosphatidylserine decarboxylase